MIEPNRWVVAGTPVEDPYPEEFDDAWFRENSWWAYAFGTGVRWRADDGEDTTKA